MLRRHCAARHRPGYAHDRLADPHAIQRVFVVSLPAVEVEQHPETARVDLGCELVAQPFA